MPVFHRDAALISNAVNGHEAHVVRRVLVFDSRIAQANDQFHAFRLLAPDCGPVRERRMSISPNPNQPNLATTTATSFLSCRPCPSQLPRRLLRFPAFPS